MVNVMNSCSKDGCQDFKVCEHRLRKAREEAQHLDYFEAKISINHQSSIISKASGKG